MNINFDLHDLQAFSAAAELGNFRKAAEAVHISQPAFSRRIDKLENALGVKLIDRSTRSMSLTGVGRDFARKVRLLLDDLDETLLGIQEVGGARMGEVTVACVPSAVYYFLPQVLRTYHAKFPRIRERRVNFQISSRRNVVTLVCYDQIKGIVLEKLPMQSLNKRLNACNLNWCAQIWRVKRIYQPDCCARFFEGIGGLA